MTNTHAHLGVLFEQEYIERIHTVDGKVVIDPPKTGSLMLHDTKKNYPEWKHSAHKQLIEFIDSNLERFETLPINEKTANLKARIGLMHQLQDSNIDAAQLNAIAVHLA